MLRITPHTVVVYSATQTLNSELTPIVPVFASVGTVVSGLLTPKTFDAAVRNWGVELSRPHSFHAEVSTLDLWKVGNRVRLRGSEGVTEVVTLTLAGASGGAFTLTYEGQTTGNIAHSDAIPTTAATVQTALRALTTIGASGVGVTRAGAASPYVYTITFAGTLVGVNVWDMIVTSSLTGTTPTAVISTNNRDRCFTVAAPPRVYNGGMGTDHLMVALDELQFGE